MLQATVFFILFYQIHSQMASVSLYKNDFSAPKAAFPLGRPAAKTGAQLSRPVCCAPVSVSSIWKSKFPNPFIIFWQSKRSALSLVPKGFLPYSSQLCPEGGNPVFAGQCFPRCCELWLMRRHLCRDGHHHTGRGCGSSLCSFEQGIYRCAAAHSEDDPSEQ